MALLIWILKRQGPLDADGGCLNIFLSSITLSGSRVGWVVRWCWINFQCWGDLLIWLIVGQGPTALAVGAKGGRLDIFTLIYLFSLSPSLWETPDID